MSLLRKQFEQDLADELEVHGLSVLGWFDMFDSHDGLQGMPTVLIGNRGRAMWQAFETSEVAGDGIENALDRWTKAVMEPIAQTRDAVVLYPFLEPEDPHGHWPFQQWAKVVLNQRQSPLGLLIDPQYGLWQAFRAALVVDAFVDIAAIWSEEHPCDTCQDKPCLTTCPVDAVSPSGFDVGACRKHLASPAGSACINKGCIARNACQVGREHAYGDEQQAFHMRALGV